MYCYQRHWSGSIHSVQGALLSCCCENWRHWGCSAFIFLVPIITRLLSTEQVWKMRSGEQDHKNDYGYQYFQDVRTYQSTYYKSLTNHTISVSQVWFWPLLCRESWLDEDHLLFIHVLVRLNEKFYQHFQGSSEATSEHLIKKNSMGACYTHTAVA